MHQSSRQPGVGCAQRGVWDRGGGGRRHTPYVCSCSLTRKEPVLVLGARLCRHVDHRLSSHRAPEKAWACRTVALILAWLASPCSPRLRNLPPPQPFLLRQPSVDVSHLSRWRALPFLPWPSALTTMYDRITGAWSRPVRRSVGRPALLATAHAPHLTTASSASSFCPAGVGHEARRLLQPPLARFHLFHAACRPPPDRGALGSAGLRAVRATTRSKLPCGWRG